MAKMKIDGSVRQTDGGDKAKKNLLTFYFCLSLMLLGVSQEERDVCLLHVRMPGQGGMLYKDSVSLTPLIQVFWGGCLLCGH